MAVYYKWIKGTQDCNNFMAIQWPTIETISDTPTLAQMPEILMSNNISMTDSKKWGNILTDKVQNVKTAYPWTFNGIGITNNLHTCNLKISELDGHLHINGTNVIIGKTLNVTSNFNVIEGKSTFQNALFQKEVKMETTLKIAEGCTAKYFNATSDKRAKENLKPIDFSATDFISKLPIYSFNYKHRKDNVVGILAQDLLQVQSTTSLNLVDNIDASGEENDFMSIKESKLVYLCMKAIQEQQEEIKELKEQIKNLTK